MTSNEQGIIKMLQDKINESEEKIKSFRQAISALSGGGTTGAASAKPGKRRGRKPGSKNKAKAAAKPAAVKAVASKPRRKRRRRSKAGKPKATAIKAASKTTRTKASRSKSAKKSRKPRSGETMEGWVLKQFDDNTPKTARSLMERYNKDTGKKLEMNGFSARLAIIKKKGSVKSMKNAADGLSYNGKAEWFDNGKLKKEYLPKG
ncbi:MAG TPA: hypothetical protein VE978_08735 [Chitinophagales bacterium]|nr:hypothetical protein [Chitinophagales bacterium]